MYTAEQMNGWNYATAHKFFSDNAGKMIPEMQEYLRSLGKFSATIDLRGENTARETILKLLKKRSLILMDGCSLTGKSTFAKRLAKVIGATVVDIDSICINWIDKKIEKAKDPTKKMQIMLNVDVLTDQYLLDNLEKIVEFHSKKGSVILVGSYMEVMYRAVISKTLGKYFEQMVSFYCTVKNFSQMMELNKKREKEFGKDSPQIRRKNKADFIYSQRLLEDDGFWLGLGMDVSFISDLTVSDMFAK